MTAHVTVETQDKPTQSQAAATGRRLPAEWEPQSAVQLTWPGPVNPWGEHSPAVEQTLGSIAAAVSGRSELVLVAVESPDRAVQRLHEAAVNMEYVRLIEARSNDSWARDHGGISVFQNGAPLLLDFRFTGWGGKYAGELDDALTSVLAREGAFGKTPVERIDFPLEGGGIETDGAGTLLTTTHCLTNPNRYAGLKQEQVEATLRQYLGVERVLWLREGAIAGDDTDSHIDTLARFCRHDTIAYAIAEDSADPNYEALRRMERELESLRTTEGKAYTLVPLPLPRPVYDEGGQQLPATYANFLIINDAVLVPTYGDARDELAMGRIQDCFPERMVIGINCRDVIRQFGSLHCLTMQYPRGVVPEGTLV